MRVVEAPIGGKYREKVAAALNGSAGAWGDPSAPDMLVVTKNAGGELIVSAAVGDAAGVIWTKEGTQATVQTPVAGFATNEVYTGEFYTVFTWAKFSGAAAAGLSAGDQLYSDGSGGVTTTPGVGAIFIGEVLADGDSVIINVNGKPTG